MNESKVHKLSLTEWVDYNDKHPTPGFNWLEKFYWEQRAGAWVKNSYQMIDMFDSDRINPLNCMKLLQLFLAFDKTYYNVKHKGAEIDLINKCAPDIADIPYGEYHIPTLKDKILNKLKGRDK